MKRLKKIFTSKIFKYTILFIIIGALLTGFFLLLGARYDLMGWTNAITFTAVLFFAFIWLSFANNQGTFDMLIFGVKSFFNAFKKDYEKMSYFEYTQEKEKLSKEYYISLTIAFVIYLIPSIILLIKTT